MSADPCERARWELCCLAAGVPPGDDGVLLARHARRCRACERFADGLCRLRARLARAQATLGREPADASMASRAREALARELRARLARDLLALGRGDPPREARLVEADLARLALLPGPLEADAVLRRWLAGGAPPGRRRALILALRLDPLGLDLALDWLGVLARRGREGPAQRLADRLLEVASSP